MAFVGRLIKENSDISRFTVDFTLWLDAGETISAVSNATITYGNSGWSTTQPPSNPAATPYDPTTLTFVSNSIINSSTMVQTFIQAGTPGSVYTVSYVVSGTSGRKKTVEVGVQLSGTPPTIPIANTQTTTPLAGYLPLNGGTMLGALYLFEDPVVPTEAATKNYVDTLFSTQVNDIAAEAVARSTADAVNLGLINAETVRAEAAEAAITSAATTEVTNRNSAITAAVLGETNRAEAAEATLQTNINTANAAIAAEVSRATAAEGVVAAAVSAETSRATAAEATLTTSIATEATNRTAAITAAIAAETALIIGQKIQAGSGGTNGAGVASITFAVPFPVVPVVTMAITGPAFVAGGFVQPINVTQYGFSIDTAAGSTPTVAGGPIGFTWIAMVPTQ